MSDIQNSPMLGNTSSGTGVLGPIASLISQIQSDTRNWATFGINTYNATEDRKFRNEMWDYQKKLNQIMMEREDSAITRRAADLANAGINPLLAGNWNGGAAAQAGGVINQTSTSMIPQEIQSNILAQSLANYEEQKIQREQIKSNETIAEAEQNIQKTNAEANKLNSETNRLVAETNKKLGESKDNREWQEYYQSILNFKNEMEHKTAELNQRKAEHLETIRDHKTRLIAENNWKEAENLINETKNKIMDRANSINADKTMSENEYRNYLKELDNKKFEFEKKVGTSSEARNWVNSIWGNVINTAKLILNKGKDVSVNNTYTGSLEQYHYGTEYRAGTINKQ